MIFIIVLSLFTFFLLSALAWVLTTQAVTGPLKTEGPKRVGDVLRRRNRSILVATAMILCVLAVLEALWIDFSFAIQDIQADTFGEALPLWGIVELSRGSISWALYAGLLTAAIAGLIAGTLFSCRRHSVLRTLSAGRLV